MNVFDRLAFFPLALMGFFDSTALFSASLASAPPPAPLYEGTVPDARGSADADAPHLAAFVPPPGPAPTAAIVICPGGAYAALCLDYEGTNEAAWFQQHGVAAFVLQYRLPAQGYRHPVPLHDGQRAIRWVRSHAAEFHLDPAKVGVMGFSAGGHLASTLETHFDAGDPQAPDPVDRLSSRPDFAVLVYPVISMQTGLTHAGSRDNLLGPNPDPALVASLSNETQVTAQTPPTILFHAQDDNLVSIENSRAMYAALQHARVPSELHEYPHGGHGFGWHEGQTIPAGWFEVTLYGWLKKQGFAP